MMAQVSWQVSDALGSVEGIYLTPPKPQALLLLAHGAGAGMDHPFMEGVAAAFTAENFATLRYQFPYTQAARKRPDPPADLQATVRSAALQARRLAPRLPLLAGGKSMGGRITADVCGQGHLPEVRGLFFLGYPLHPPGKPSVKRAAALHHIEIPMLFVRGSKDRLADPTLMQALREALGDKATWSTLDDADHGFAVPKRRGLTAEQVFTWLGQTVSSWCTRFL